MEEGFSAPDLSDAAPSRPPVASANGLGERPWLAHYSAGVPASASIPERSLSWLLDEATRTSSAYTAIEYYGTRITYAQFSSLADRFARALARLGVKRGDRVAISLPNIPQFPIAFYGAIKAGAVVVPTNPLYQPHELEHQLSDSGAKVVVMVDQLYHTLAEVRPRTPIEHVILAGVADYFPLPLAVAYRARAAMAARHQPHIDQRALRADKSVHQFKDLLGHASDSQGFEVYALPESAKPDDLALLQYTGGTTGVAKGAMLTHRNLMANAAQALAWNEDPPETKHVSLCVAPFFHVYGLTVGMNLTMLAASTMVLLPRFTVKDTLKAIEKYHPDLFPGAPTMYLALAREVERKHHDLSSLRVCISGSAPLPAEVQRRFEAVSGAKLVEGYGLTEASPVTHCNPVYGDRRLGTIGLPVCNTDSGVLVGDSWDFAPQGQQGEIVVRGPQVMLGYWNRPDETAKVLRDGWLRTGDIGQMDADGYFSVVDRKKDLIIASGYNIYPREVEDVLFANPKVLEAAVAGIPDEYRGETVRAYIVVKPGETLTVEELDKWCREQLAVYKVPKSYEFRESLPKTVIGKVLRRQLRDETLAAQQPERSDEAKPA
ncbi:MAG TPA: long-chain fatty acid--CoA ligase [Ktedonobacterales bacterium]|nr:long-chain fatty acid--CoA ligase [Ktedonobacterales bacterium]